MITYDWRKPKEEWSEDDWDRYEDWLYQEVDEREEW